MKSIPIIFFFVIALTHSLAVAQTWKIFNGNNIKESALVEALSPDHAEVNPTGIRTRSIRVSPVGQAAVSRVKQPSASMLITFETNSAELTPKAKQTLDVLGRALQSDKLAAFKFSIEGHADPRGGEQFNLQLSQLRADSVVRYLAESQNIDQGRLVAVGKGQSELMNTTNPAAQENRRVTVKTVVQ